MAIAIGVLLAIQLSSGVAEEVAYRSVINLASRDSLATIQLAGGGTADSYRQLQNVASQAVASHTSDLMTPISEYGTVSGLAVHTVNGGQLSLQGLAPVQVIYYPALHEKADLTAGTWRAPGATQEIQATVAAIAANVYGWRLGDLICLSSANDTANQPAQACIRLVGMWRPAALNEPFWLSPPPSSAFTLGADDYWSLARTLPDTHFTSTRIYQPNPTHLRVADAPSLAEGITRMRSTLLSGGIDLYTTLDRTIAVFLQHSAVNRFPVYLVGADLIAVALFGLGFLSQAFVASQERQCLLWRTRGWGRSDIARFLCLQIVMLAIPAFLVGTTSAVGAAWFEAARSGVDAKTFLSDLSADLDRSAALSLVGALVVCLAIVIRFSSRTVGEMRRMARRPASDAWWHSRNIDLALAVIAVPVLAEASLRGAAVVRSQHSGLDWIGLALPILGLTFLAIAALRLLPVAVQPLRLIPRDVPARLARWRLSREPNTHSSAAMLLSLALATGIFASVYATTADANAADRAAYATGADLRIAFASDVEPSVISQQLARLDGVIASTAVIRQRIQISESVTATALAVDPKTYARASWSRPGLSSPSLPKALAELSSQPSIIELPGTPTALRLSVRGVNDPIVVVAIVRDATGQTCDCTFGNLQGGRWQTLNAPLAFSRTPSFPVRLEALRFHRMAKGSPETIEVARLQSISGSDISDIESFASVTGWWGRDQTGLVSAPGVNGVQDNGQRALSVAVGPVGDTTLSPPFSRDGLPLLMSDQTMSRLALRIGDSVVLTVDSHHIVAKLAGPIDFVPTLYPGSEDFVLLPLDRAVSVLAAALGRSVSPTELWLAMTYQGQQVAMGLVPNADINFIANRQHEQSVTANDPVLIQLNTNLAVGMAGALMLALLGFAVHFLVVGRRRVAEHAILEANGLDPADVRRSLAIEQVVIAAYALVVAIGLAGVSIGALLPSLQFGTAPEVVIPPTVILVEWCVLLTAGIIGAVIVAVLAWVTLRFGTSVDVVDEVRKLG